VHVHSYSNVEDSVLLPNVTISRRAKLKRVVVDKNCVIPEGLAVGFNPENDKKVFFVTPKGVTLITRQMLGQDAHGSGMRTP